MSEDVTGQERTSDDGELIRSHYSSEAAAHALAPTSTMADQTTRELEVDAIRACIRHAERAHPIDDLLEVGCGNGYLLSLLRTWWPGARLHGLDYSDEMVELARSRALAACVVQAGDARALPWPDQRFDVVVTERCVINLLEPADQDQALEELHRVLRPGGHLVLVEAFTDGLDNLNRARDELGLAPLDAPYHNRWLDKQRVLALLEPLSEPVPDDGADPPPSNFLSSHYFISRVLYPAVTQREIRHNTEFVQFFRFLPPNGLFSPIQLLFRRRSPDDAPDR